MFVVQPPARHISALAVTIVALLTSTAFSQAPAGQRTTLETKSSGSKIFYCDDRAGNNQVTVFSESSLEDFTAVCNRVAGQCTIEPQHVETLAGKFSIQVKDLKTGMDLRDHHMAQSDWLDAAKHPTITIEITKVEEVRKTAPTSASLTLVCACTLHGQTQPLRIPANLTYLDETAETMRRVKGDLLRIRANFDLKLSDYGIVGPKGSDYIGLKVAPIVRIKVTVFGSTERPADPLKVDRPSGSGAGPGESRPPRPNDSRPPRPASPYKVP